MKKLKTGEIPKNCYKKGLLDGTIKKSKTKKRAKRFFEGLPTKFIDWKEEDVYKFLLIAYEEMKSKNIFMNTIGIMEVSAGAHTMCYKIIGSQKFQEELAKMRNGEYELATENVVVGDIKDTSIPTLEIADIDHLLKISDELQIKFSEKEKEVFKLFEKYSGTAKKILNV